MKPELDLTGCSERERELVEALYDMSAFYFEGPPFPWSAKEDKRLVASCQAYLKKPEPVPVLPDWNDLSYEERDEIAERCKSNNPAYVYDQIRRITAKPPEA